MVLHGETFHMSVTECFGRLEFALADLKIVSADLQFLAADSSTWCTYTN